MVRIMGKEKLQRNGAFNEMGKLLHIHSLLPHHAAMSSHLSSACTRELRKDLDGDTFITENLSCYKKKQLTTAARV